MKTYNLELSNKSISNLIREFNLIKSQLPQMIYDFLNTCCSWIYEQAEMYIRNSDIGDNVKEEIIRGWQPPIITQDASGAVAIFSNKHDQACFVEFGVGIVGSYLPHIRASQAGYKYNVPSPYKSASGQWVFKIDKEENLDLGVGYYKKVQNSRGDEWIITKGSPAVMYAYNACVDLITFGYKSIWETIKKKYWG